jgi:hypothetical protein
MSISTYLARKPCEYCGCDLPLGTDKPSRQIRSAHFLNCAVRLEGEVADHNKPAQPAQEFDYAYPTIEEYEELTGFKVNDTFRMGWAMARTTNDLFRQMEKNT